MSSWSSSVLGWDLVVPRIGEGREVSVGAVDPGRQCQECPLGSPAGSWRSLGALGSRCVQVLPHQVRLSIRVIN